MRMRYNAFIAGCLYFLELKPVFRPFPVSPGLPNIITNDSDIQAVSIIIRWTKPVSDGGSVLTGYKVWINTEPPREILTTETHANIPGLKKNTRYTVKVHAGNVAGYGDPAVVSFTTKKQGKHETEMFGISLINVNNLKPTYSIFSTHVHVHPICPTKIL